MIAKEAKLKPIVIKVAESSKVPWLCSTIFSIWNGKSLIVYLSYTLFCDLYFSAAKFSLLDVLHTEVAAALGVDLGFVPGGGFIIRAVGVGCSWEIENAKGHYAGMHTKEPIMKFILQIHCKKVGACVCCFSCLQVCCGFIANVCVYCTYVNNHTENSSVSFISLTNQVVEWNFHVSITWAVAVCGGLRDGPGEGAAACLGGVLTEFLFVLCVCELDLVKKKTGQSVTECEQHMWTDLNTIYIIARAFIRLPTERQGFYSPSRCTLKMTLLCSITCGEKCVYYYSQWCQKLVERSR